MPKRFFLAGIIQGSQRGRRLYPQDYRERIKRALEERFPRAVIFCPYELHPNSIDYDSEKGKETFLRMIEEAKRSDCLVAYLPEASLGTAIEIWECYKSGVPIWTISPMGENWVVKFFSTKIFPSLSDFETYLKEPEVVRSP